MNHPYEPHVWNTLNTLPIKIDAFILDKPGLPGCSRKVKSEKIRTLTFVIGSCILFLASEYATS